MDLSFTPDELAFREEARRFFRSEIPESMRTKVLEGQHLSKQEIITAQRILNARGWAGAQTLAGGMGRAGLVAGAGVYVQDEMQQAGDAVAARLSTPPWSGR